MTIEIDIIKGPQNIPKFNMSGFTGAAMYQDMDIDGENRSFRWEDGDTVYDDITDQGYRLRGFNAFETEHIGLPKQVYKSGEVGGETQKRKFYELAKKMGYNKLVKTGEKDKYGRYIADLQNAQGQSFATSLYSNGLMHTNHFTSEKDKQAYESRHFNSLMGIDTTTSEWGKAKIEIDDYMNRSTLVDQNGNPLMKVKAMNEWELNNAQIASELYGVINPYMDHTVEYRHEGMDIYGKAYNPFRTGLKQGWMSILESASGAKSLLGSLVGNQRWYEQGMLNADSRAEDMKRLPSFVQNIHDVEFGENAAEYIMGLGGVAIPYMLGIIGAGVAGTLAVGAGATGLMAALGTGIAITPIAAVYAGEVFNNMEGDINTKDGKVAIMAGIAMSVLDRLGLKGILKPSQVLKKDGYKQVEEQLLKREIDGIKNRFINEEIKTLKNSSKYANMNSSQKKAAEAGARTRGSNRYDNMNSSQRAVAEQGAKTRAATQLAEAKLQGVLGLVKSMAGHADIQIKKQLLLKEFGVGMMKGTAIESATETWQEGIGNIASAYGSEKDFNWAEFQNIVENAAVGGALMGGTIGGVSSGASGYGSIKKMQSDYGTAKENAGDGFFNYAEDEKGNTLGHVLGEDGSALGHVTTPNGHTYSKPMTQLEFDNDPDMRGNKWSVINKMTEDQKNNNSNFKNNTWEPAFVDVEDINDEIVNAFDSDKDMNESEIQRQIDEEVKIGEGKGQTEDGEVVVPKMTLWERAKKLPKQMFMKYGAIEAGKLNDPDLNPTAKRYLSALLQTFAQSNIGLAVGVGFMKVKGRLTQGFTQESTNLRTALLNTVNKPNTSKGVEEATQTFREFVESKRAMERGDKTLQEHKTQWGAMEKRLDVIHNRMTQLTDTLRKVVNANAFEEGEAKMGYVEDWFFNSAKLDTTKLVKGKGVFVNALQQDWTHPKTGQVHKGISKEAAEDLYEKLIFDFKGQREVLTDSIYHTTTDADATKKVTLNINDNPLMQDFLHTDHFGKLDNNIHDMVNFAMDMKYLGRNDIKLNKMIMKVKDVMGDKWDPSIAATVRNSVDTQRGKYKAIRSKALKKAQDHITFFNTLTQLDTSMLASLPELALVMVGAAYHKGLINIVRQGAKDVGKHYAGTARMTKGRLKGQSLTDPTLQDVMSTPRIIEKFGGKEGQGMVDRTAGERLDISIEDINMNRLSFYGGMYGTAQHGVLGAVDIDSAAYNSHKWRTWILESFFRMNGLKFLTDGSRVARLAIANDAIFTDLEIINGFYEVGKTNSNYANDAYERLRELNIDPVKTAKLYANATNEVGKLAAYGTEGFQPTKDGKLDSQVLHEYIFKNHAELYNILEDGRISFVDNALARPTSVDRPLWYSNPHFRLLTQYQGFLSTFTSHIIPKLYKRAKKADPTLRYQAFAVAATMLALAILGQELKDEWKFGRHSPYVDTNLKTAQRALSASGLLGTGHRLLDFVHPIYTSKPRYNQTTLDQLGRFAGHTIEEFGGPSGGTLKNASRIATNIISGKNATALYYARNWIPLIGRHQKGERPYE